MRHDPKHEIRVYEYVGERNPFIRRGTIYRYESVRIIENFYSAGSFELRIPWEYPYAKELQKGRFVEIGRRFAGRITGTTLEANQNGDMLTVIGTDTLGLLSARVTVPAALDAPSALAGYDGVSGSSETVIKHFLRNNTTEPASVVRKIPGLIILPDRERGSPDDKYLSRFENLAEVVSKVAADAELGIVCYPDWESGQFYFDVKEGSDCTVNQGDLPPVVVSTARRTAMSMQFAESDAGLKNAFYTSKSGEQYADETLTLTYYRDENIPSGLDRRETHLSISAEHPIAGEEYNELQRLATLAMKDHAEQMSFTAQINQARVIYNRDFCLGDMVTVQHLGWGVTMDIRVVGMTTEFTGGTDTYTAQFGTQKQTFINIIKKAIKTEG